MPVTTAVFDTNTLFQAILSDTGPAMDCLEAVLDGNVELIVCNETLTELLNIIRRPRLLSKYPQLSSERTFLLVKAVFAKASVCILPKARFALDRDPSDEVFLNLVIENNAEYLVTRDNDLLGLMKDSNFVSQFPALNIVTPVGFLEIVRAV